MKSFTDYTSIIWLQIDHKSENGNDVTICLHGHYHHIFNIALFLLSNLGTSQISCQYHYWFWSYGNFLLQGIDHPEI